MNGKVFLFDFDGTVADSITTLVNIFNELADLYHLPRKIKKEDLQHLRQIHLHQIIKDFQIPSSKIPFLLYEGRKKFSQQIPLLQPIKGIKQALSSLKAQGMTLGIVTSNSKGNVYAFLKKNHLELFDFIYSEKGLFGKDKVLKHLLQTYKFPLEHTFYIGDEIRDIDAARKTGLKIISVTWGANDKEALIKATPDYLVDKPSELLRFSD